jgi:hypothetical protein
MKNSKNRMFFSMLFITVILSSCLNMAGRLFTVREQMCEFDDYFSIQIDQGVEITLFEPVLLEKDVYLVMDAKPTSRFESAEGVIASYVFTQLQTTADGQRIPTDEEIEFKLLFVPTDKGLALAEIRSSEIPTEILESALPFVANSAEMAQKACHFSINPFSTSVMLEIDQDMLGLLPERQALVSWLGLPIEPGDSIGDLSYEFLLKGEQAGAGIARVDMDYDHEGQRPLTIEASFTRYRASIDVPAGTLQMKLY